MPSIADTYVTVLPETSKIADGIVRAFREVDPKAAEAGRRWGQEIERGIGKVNVEVKADTTKAKAEIDAAARDHHSTIHVDVDKDRLGQSLQSGAEDAVSQMGPRLAGSAASAGGSIGSSMGSPLTAALIAAGVTGLAGIASAASGVLGVIPAGLAGAGSVIGTLVVGLNGVKDAWDAAGKAAQTSGQDQATKSREVASAQRDLRSAVQDESRAQQDVANARKDALRQLQDLNLELRGGALDEKQAILDVQAAQRDLRTGRFRDNIEYQQAVLRVQQAEERVAEVRSRNGRLQEDANAANQRGVDNAPQVVAANQNLANVQDRISVATDNLTRVTNQQSSSQLELARTMGLISPQAQAFVQTLIGMKPAFQEFQNSIQDALFNNLGPMFQQLATTYMPMLQGSLTTMATLLNQAFGQFAQFMQQPATMQMIQTILNNVNASFQAFLPTINTITQAFLKLTETGTSFLPQLGQIIDQVAQGFSQFVNSGDLGAWIQTGMDVMKQLVPIGFQLLQIFRDLAPIGPPVLNAIGQVLTALAPAIAPLAGALAAWVQAGTPFLTLIAQLASQILTALAPAFQIFYQAMKPVWEAIASQLGPVIGQIMPLVGQFAVEFANLFAACAPLIPPLFQMGTALFPVLLEAIEKILPFFTQLTQIFTSIATDVVPKVANALKGLVDTFTSAWNGIGGVVETVWNKIKPIFEKIIELFGKVAGPLKPLLDALKLLLPDLNISMPDFGAPSAGGTTPGGRNIPQVKATGASVASSIGPKTITPSVAAAAGAQPIYTPGTTQLPQWVLDLAKQFNLTPSTYADGGSLHQGGYAVDFNGAPADLERFAQYIQQNLAGQTLQLIFESPSGKKYGIAGGAAVGPGTSSPGYYANDFAGHRDHVHWATDTAVGVGSPSSAAPSMPAPNITGSSNREQIAQFIIAEAQKRGFSREQTIAVLATAMQESNLNPAASGGGGAWHGIFQQDTSYPGRDNPATNISTFFDRLGAPGGDIWGQIFGLQQGTSINKPGARTGYLSEIQSKTGPATELFDQLFGKSDPAMGLNPTQGTQQNPMYVDYGANSGFAKQSGGEQLGQDIVSGIMEIFGIDGSVFKNFMGFGAFKFMKSGLNLLTKGGDGASQDNPQGGGGLLQGLLQGFIPQPFNPQHGSPQQAPGEFTPFGDPGSSGGQLNFFNPQGPPPGPAIDNSITVNTTGTPQQGFDAANQANVPRMRQGLRPFG